MCYAPSGPSERTLARLRVVRRSRSLPAIASTVADSPGPSLRCRRSAW
jgi:hypothetical protein